MKSIPLFSLLLLLASCSDFADTGAQGQALGSGTPEALGVLRLLNDPQVDFALLDDDARLDKRAARNLISHRDGEDGFYGTNDDKLFTSIDEVDAVAYVGPSALAKLLDYATANAYLPGPEDILGSYDGVVFTVEEAERTLTICNEESEGVLDSEVGLDSRAVASILAARPIDSVEELATLYYVGASALNKFKSYVDVPASSERADCKNHGECEGSDVCEGIPFDGSSEYGKCHAVGNIPGVGVQCSLTEPCGADLFCGGLTMWNVGFCIADWQQDTFVNSTQRFIPELTPIPVATSVTVRGQATVPFDITVDVDLAHGSPENLKITLYDPNGTDAVLWDGPNETSAFPGSFIALGNISRDDTVNGRWLLRVTNETGQSVGNLHGWTLWLSSNFD